MIDYCQNSGLYTPVLPDIYLLLELLDGELKNFPTDLAERVAMYLRYQFAIIILFWTNLWLIKGSFMCLYKKLLHNTHGWQQTAWWSVAAFCIMTYIGDWVLQFMACTPFHTYFKLGKQINHLAHSSIVC